MMDIASICRYIEFYKHSDLNKIKNEENGNADGLKLYTE